MSQVPASKESAEDGRAGQDRSGTWSGTGHIIVFDYPGRRAEAAVSDLELAAEGLTISNLLKAPLPTALTADSYAAALFAAEPSRHKDRATFLAYCASSAVAVAYGRLVAGESRRKPSLVCFDAGPCTLKDLEDCYWNAVNQIERGQAGSRSAVSVPVASLADRPEELIGAVREDLSRRMMRALAADGITGSEVIKPVSRTVESVISWLTHLIACRHSSAAYRDGVVLNVISQDHEDQAEWFTGAEVLTVRVNCSRVDLLRHPETRAIVLSFLRDSSSLKCRP